MQRIRKPYLILALILIIVISLVVYAVARPNKQTGQISSNANSAAKGEKKNSQSSSSSAQTSASGTNDKTTGNSGPSVDTTTPLQAPSGSFVSSHHVVGNGLIESVCNTTPGATCTISFTKSGVTKQLPPKTVDANGSSYWDWRPDDIGLDPGSWTITANASLGTQKQSTTDPLALEIQ